MKRKIALAVVTLVILVFLLIEAKHKAVDYYFANFHERTTAYPASETPDQLILTWPGDPKTTEAANWRTASSVSENVVQYRRADAPESDTRTVEASYTAVEDSLLINDPQAYRWTGKMEGLEPGTSYTYRVGNADSDTWTEWAQFTTAPAAPEPFSFMYLGDPQKGLGVWGKLVRASYERNPNTAFYMIAGDLVNDGNWRDEWDEFFEGSSPVFRQVPVIPCLGNHDVDDNLEAVLYLDSFALPENGPASVGPERAFSFTYSNAFFVVLDSNLSVQDQTAWLEEQLAGTDATWKFVMYHHPAYPSAPHRSNDDVKKLWGVLFDKYHVDMALQGHDHAYLRTYPMNNGKRVGSAAEGTYYVVSVSGTKFYDQIDRDYAELAFPNVMTYQTLDITTNPDRLTYRAFDMEGTVRDELVIEK